MDVILIAIYLFFCWAVAYAGKNTRLGFWGVLLLSIFLTPLLIAIFIVLFQPRIGRKN